MGGYMSGWVNGQMWRWVDEYGQMGRWIQIIGQMTGCIDGWMDRQVYDIDRWIDGQMSG